MIASSGPPAVTVLIPVHNEAADIEDCLGHVAAQDYALDRIEVIVVDGASTDGTAELARAALARTGFGRVEVIANPASSTPSNLNRGLAAATGDVVCRIDARSRPPRDYVRRCVELLETRRDIAVTGGRQVALARDDSPRSRGIERALNNRWGMGLSRYRRGAPSGSADTVYLGAFRTAELRSAGGWDERLSTNQDFDLNRRLAVTGVIWVDADLAVGYLPRRSIGDLFEQYHRFGRWKVRYWRWTGSRPSTRQAAILIAPPVAGLAVLVASRGRPARLAALVGVGLAGVGLIEQLGRPSDGPDGVEVRLTSVGALVAVWSGWLSGIAREAVGSSGAQSP